MGSGLRKFHGTTDVNKFGPLAFRAIRDAMVEDEFTGVALRDVPLDYLICSKSGKAKSVITHASRAELGRRKQIEFECIICEKTSQGGLTVKELVEGGRQ